MAGFARRDLIILGGVSAAMIGWQQYRQRPSELNFIALRDAPGWSFASTGQSSGLSGSDFMTIGLKPSPAPLPIARLSHVVHHAAMGQGVPVAVFSDFFCPFCRKLIARLMTRTWPRPLAISWHELPLLGPNSVLVAQVAQAAALQQAYPAFYAQLLQDGFRPSMNWLVNVAEKAGLNGQLLREDTNSAEVARRLSQSHTAATQLGIHATPGMAIGQRVVLGAMDARTLEILISTTPQSR